ncbi:hypothetical protein ASG68_22495 [Rhizobium sp. Leaf453]|nr:hypothetical protein ASG68_22495 [Rhizobium sp. Leaf453]
MKRVGEFQRHGVKPAARSSISIKVDRIEKCLIWAHHQFAVAVFFPSARILVAITFVLLGTR